VTLGSVPDFRSTLVSRAALFGAAGGNYISIHPRQYLSKRFLEKFVGLS